MALNIKDPVAEQLTAELAALAHETKTEAVRTAVRERLERLETSSRRQGRSGRLERFLSDEAWPQIPADVLGQPLSKADRESILGYGPEGV